MSMIVPSMSLFERATVQVRALGFAILLAVAVTVGAPASSAQDQQRPEQKSEQKSEQRPGARERPAAPEQSAPPADSVTRHGIDVDGRRLAYKATAGTLPLLGPKGETAAHVFYTSFVVEGAPAPRPLTFLFNGGPGAASAFLNIGAAGPRIVGFNETGSAAVQPVGLVDNPDTWLAFSDLVFVDPVSTGYSRAVGGDDDAKDKFYGTEKDAAANAAVVQRYLARAGRSLDAVFLAGESYGGFRVAQLGRRLLRAGLDVRGLILISPAIEFSMIRGDELMALPKVLALPSLAFSHQAASAGGVPDPELRQEVEAFARGPYLLHQTGRRQNDPEITARLARYTGIASGEIERQYGRIGIGDYVRGVRRRTGHSISLYDGTVRVQLPRPAGDHHPDPILDYAVAALVPAFSTYARKELGYIVDQPYRLLNREVSGRWDYGTSPTRQGFAGALDDIEAARAQRPSLRVLFAGGYADLVTPYAVSQYLIDQMKPLDGAAPVELKVYAGGHMMYLRPASRQALARDVRTLFSVAMKTE